MKAPTCLQTDERIEKLWYRYTMEYDSAIKRSEFGSVLVRWMNLEPVTESEVRKRKTIIIYILMHIYGI